MTGDDLERAFYRDWDAGKVRRVSDGKRMVPEREWVGLTDEDISGCINSTASLVKGQFLVEFSKSIEAKLKEKNNAD